MKQRNEPLPEQQGKESEASAAKESETDLLHLFVESVEDYAIFMLDPEGRVASWNQGAQRFKGYAPAEIIGQPYSRFFTEADREAGRPERQLELAATWGRAEDEGWRVRKDGSLFWANAVITALRDGEGKLRGFAKVTRDMSERRKAEQNALQLAREEARREDAEASSRRMAFLADASRLLGGSLDYRSTLASVSRLAVPPVADWCTVRLLEGEELSLLAVAWADPSDPTQVRQLGPGETPASRSTAPEREVLQQGEPRLFREITDELLVEVSREAAHLAKLREAEIGSAMLVPLEAPGRRLGTLGFFRGRSRPRFDDPDLAMAVELAGRAAAAIDNALVHQALRQALGEREEALRRLASERERLDAVLRQMPAGVVIADAPDGIITLANEQARKMLGASPLGQPIGTNPGYTANHPDGSRFARNDYPLHRALHRGEVVVGEELPVTLAGGERRFLLINAAPIHDGEGRIVAAVSAFQDITLRKEAEEAAEQQAHFREQFIAILGHDLRNPLGAISMATQLLLRKGLPEAQARPVARIATAAERMERMISDLLDLTRSRLGGGIPISPRPADLRAIVRYVVEENEAAHPESRLQEESHGNLRGEWDADRIAQVLSNLIGNAISYGQAAGPIRILLRESAPGGEVLFSVHNEGPAIPEEILPVLFDPFRRGRDDAGGEARPSRGLGLGLFISEQIVKAHGGTIEVESSEERGTTFTVRLPRRSQASGSI